MDRSLSDILRRANAIGERLAPAASASEFGPAATVAEMRRTVEDRSAPSDLRRAALVELSERLHGQPEFPEVVLAAFDDPDDSLAREAIGLAPPFDGRVIAKLRDLLDDPRPSRWEAAASALSRKKDRAILPLMLSWARRGDAPHRRVGLSAIAFLLIPEDHLAAVESLCEDGPRDDEDEAILIDALRTAESRVAFWRRAVGESET